MQATLPAARERALRMIEQGAPLHAILAHLVASAEALSGGRNVCSILLLDR